MLDKPRVSDKEVANLRMDLRFGQHIVIPSDTLERLLGDLEELQNMRSVTEAAESIISSAEDAIREVECAVKELRNTDDAQIAAQLGEVSSALEDAEMSMRHLTSELERSRK